VVFSDVNLSGQLNGHALATWLDQHQPTIPVLLTSADPVAKMQIRSGPTRSFIPKPYDPSSVDERIQLLLAHMKSAAQS